MKKVINLVIITVIGLNINLPAQAIRVSTNDIICEFKYKVGDETWTHDSTGGTTRTQAKRFQSQVLQVLKNKALESGQDFQVIYLGCSDPFGNN